MKKIEISQNQVVLVDDEDYDLLSKFKWFYLSSKARYAARTENKTTILMHRVILNAGDGVVDHINGNGLDNRKVNLRISTPSQNQMNRGVPKNNTTGYKGLRLLPSGNVEARIQVHGKRIPLGTYGTIIEAAKAYNTAAINYFGSFARLNEV